MSDIPNNMRIALAVSDFLEGGEIIKIEVDGEWHSVKMIEFRANGVMIFEEVNECSSHS